MPKRTELPTHAVTDELEEYRALLAIDQHDLDSSLADQPDSYRRIAEAYVAAGAERDYIKLEVEELLAKVDQSTRATALKSEEKLTETALQNRIRLLPEVQAANRRLLEARRRADELGALKESFQQRSFMLRSLTDKQISERYDIAAEQGAGQTRRRLTDVAAEEARRATGALRTQRRKLED